MDGGTGLTCRAPRFLRYGPVWIRGLVARGSTYRWEMQRADCKRAYAGLACWLHVLRAAGPDDPVSLLRDLPRYLQHGLEEVTDHWLDDMALLMEKRKASTYCFCYYVKL